VKRKLLVGDDANRHQAVVLFAQAQAAADLGESKRALDLARGAHAQLADFSPATALAGRLHGAGGEMRKARRLLREGWQQSAHPDILAAWLAIHPNEEPEERLSAVQKLIADHEEDAESRYALAQAALDAGEFDTAREQLRTLMEQAPTARAARLIADLEEIEQGDGATAREWLRRAAKLPADATWVCQSCGRQTGAWAPHCPDCGSFDTFAWRQPAGAGAILPYMPGMTEEEAEPAIEAEILPPDVEPAPAKAS
jgi:HemY protein